MPNNPDKEVEDQAVSRSSKEISDGSVRCLNAKSR